MRFLFFILIFISMNSYAQFLNKTPYTIKMDSIGYIKLYNQLNHIHFTNNDHILTISSNKNIRITMKTMLNNNVVGRLSLNKTFNIDDYISIGSYDIRCKLYVNNNVRLMGRSLINGLNYDQYLYYMVVIIKF
jgi:hypothetical protein